eukprot:TRINITY_DN17590_c0_g1_i1.p1 TRINITY_DN17590_c0_g1~~TRINITY_DN17590_c0_g1_i1.p1  ORF type:complete len:424 (+),score=99.93 TRINITY_DN17590_c0_g1_i1:46-1317(+)
MNSKFCAAVAATGGAAWYCLRRSKNRTGEEQDEEEATLSAGYRTKQRGVEIAEGDKGFARLDTDGTVKRWGMQEGDAEGIAAIIGGEAGWIALTESGEIEVWGEIKEMEKEVSVHIPKNPTSIMGTKRTFVIQNKEGFCLLWGIWGYSLLEKTHIAEIRSNEYADAAVLSTGKVLTIGADAYGGGKTNITATKLYSTSQAFAGIDKDGTVQCWGDQQSGGLLPAPLTSIHCISSTTQAFTALSESGEVTSWGDPTRGGKSPDTVKAFKVKQIASTKSAFAALTTCGKIFVWGSKIFGGAQDKADMAIQGRTMKSVVGGAFAFAGITDDGCLVAWGDSEFGGSTADIPPSHLLNVTSITAGERVFAVHRSDASCTVYGSTERGGDPTTKYHNVERVVIGLRAVVILHFDGTLTCLGDRNFGGKL